MRTCRRCQAVKEDAEFYFYEKAKLFDIACKQCRRAAARERQTFLRRQAGIKPKVPKSFLPAPASCDMDSAIQRFLRLPRILA